MNPLHFFATVFLLASLAVLACKNDPQPADTTPAPDTLRAGPVARTGARTFAVTEGLVYWKGKKALGDTHAGTVEVSGGELLVNEGRLLGGQVALDMTTIAVTSLKDPGEQAELESHLRDSEFFDVKNFPSAEFKFDEALPSKTPHFNAVVTGRLTLKGKTNAVNIPVKLTIDGDELTAESPAFLINRTQWGVNFRSGVIGTAKDKLIEDVIPLSLKIKAKAR